MSKIRRMQGYKPVGLNGRPIDAEDYIYSLEVAGYKPVTEKERKIVELAKQDVRYLEAKYPGIAKKFKLFEDRVKNTEPMKSINQKKSRLGKAN